MNLLQATLVLRLNVRFQVDNIALHRFVCGVVWLGSRLLLYASQLDGVGFAGFWVGSGRSLGFT